MKTITISATSYALLSAHARNGMIYPVQKQADGRFVIELDDEVATHLSAISSDPDSAIAILCSTGVGRA